MIKKQAQEGFTLVEVLAGLAIIAILLVAALPLFTSNLRQTVQDKQREQALRLAQERLEYFIHQNVRENDQQSGQVTIDGTNFNWSLQVKRPASSSPANLKLLNLTVTVTYLERGSNASRDLSLSVLKTE
ncbi:MAG: type II secretion system protein [Bacillota bacterium]